MGIVESTAELENRTRYAAAVSKYLAIKFAYNDSPDYRTLGWFDEHTTAETLTDDDVDTIRNAAHESLATMNRNYGDDIEDIFKFDFEASYMAAGYPHASVVREVVTEDAIRYFKNLHAYLRARETGDADIDSIRQHVTASAHSLLRQLEGVIPHFSLAERSLEDANFIRADLHALINMERVRRETGLTNLFKVSDIHDFEGVMPAGDNKEGKSLGISRNSYSGIRPLDILSYLNRKHDVALHNKKDADVAQPFVTIRADGTVDVSIQDGQHLKSGLAMALDKVPADAQAKLADRIVFSARAEMVNGVALTTEVLEKNGLLPTWRVTFGNTTVYLSDKLYVKQDESGSRLRTIIYVEDEKRGLVARSCYKSNSHGVWKLLPAYSPGHYHKGHGEEQLTLLPELQRAISYLCSVEQICEADVVFYGTTRKGHGLASSFRGDVRADPVELGDGFNDESGWQQGKVKKVSPDAPTSFCFNNEEDKPNFLQVIDSWEEGIALYGGVTFEVIASRNERLRYLFCRDKNSKAWISSIDLKGAEMTPQGLKKNWVRAGDLCTPAYTYWEETGGYASFNRGVGKKGEYANMFENYLSKIPLIREYLNSVAARAK